MKKKVFAIGLITMTLCFAGCGLTGSNNSVSTGNEELDKVLEKVEEYDPLDYVTLGEYKGVEVDTSVSDEEVLYSRQYQPTSKPHRALHWQS